MALRGKTLSSMMSGANVSEAADVSESVSFIGDKGKRRRGRGGKKKVNLPNPNFNVKCHARNT